MITLMKKALYKNLVWMAVLLVAATAPAAESDFTNRLSISTNQLNIFTNRLSLSARFGFNISGKFKGIGGGLVTDPAPNPKRTPSQPGKPNGDPYNYEDGYVLTDISGNSGGTTTYWGYDSASQISGNTILLNNSIGNSTVSGDDESASPTYGGELVYNRHLGESGRKRYGLEIAFNYQSINFSDHSAYAANLTRVRDAYAFEPGTSPPEVTPGHPFQGSYEGPGFELDSMPTGPTVTYTDPGGIVISGSHRFDANLWGLRFGPYLEFPVNERINVSLSAGLAVGWLDAEASWSESGTLPSGGIVSESGHGSDFDTLWGGYARADASYDLGKKWSLLGGLQFQTLGEYNHDFDGRKVELDLRSSIFLTVGLGKSF
jgi:hypothetical protein